MIEHTKKLVEDKFTTVGGYEHNAEVCLMDFPFYLTWILILDLLFKVLIFGFPLLKITKMNQW